MPNAVSSGRSRRAMGAAVALALAGSGVALAGYYRPLTNASWDLSSAQGNPNVQLSADLKTRTERLPPVSSITADHQARVRLEFGEGDNFGASAVERVSPVGAQVSCPSTVSLGQMLFSCVAKMSWLRTLTQDTTVRLRAKSQNNQVFYLDWTFVAPPNLVFLDRIDGPGSMIKGNVAEFSLVLQQPAPQSGVSVQYQVDPNTCFTAGARRAGTQGTVSFGPNEQYKTLTVASSASCTSGNAILKTWTHQKRDQAPYYKTKSFNLLNPRR